MAVKIPWERRAAAYKIWFQKNKKKKSEYLKAWRADHPERVSASAGRSQRLRSRQRSERRLRDLNFRLVGNLRSRLTLALKSRAKTDRTSDLLGCSLESFRLYLESKFESGMSWQNYGKGLGKWNIDHIIPCSIFDLARPEHQKRCFHFSNLQPMWFEENVKKSNKLTTNQFQLI